jgi:RND family efflux transporter MFP subunit
VALPLLAALALLTGCEQDQVVPEPRLIVETYELGPSVVTRERQFHGRVVPADLTRVSFRVPGKIAQLSVQSGQIVFAGQTLARIEDSIQKQVLADARAQYQLSKRQLERAESLHRRGSLTSAQRDQLQAGYRLAQANLRLAEAGLSYTEVKAPFDGIVADVDKELYEAVTAGETVVTLYRSDRTDVLVNIPDNLLTRVHQAPDVTSMKADVVFSDIPGTYQMSILKGSTARHPGTQSFQLWITMPAPEVTLPPGLPATITIDMQQAGFSAEEGFLVPLNALQARSSADGFQVWRYEDGVVTPTPVQVSRMTQDGALILSGLQVGDLVVTSALSRLTPGQVVNIRIQDQDRP